MVTGELIPTKDRDLKYSVTIKADGVRKLLFFAPTGVYLVMAPSSVMKILDDKVATKLKNQHGTVIEGELIPKNKLSSSATDQHKKSIIYFLMYDCLSSAGNNKVRTLPHPKRREFIDNVQLIFGKLTQYIFDKKEFFIINDVPSFYSNVNMVLDDTYPFLTDGLMFGPSNYPYDLNLQKVTIKKRKLSRYPDMLKWKPQDQITIDFAINHVIGEQLGYVELLTKGTNGLVPFTGDKYHPFNAQTMLVMDEEIKKSPSKTVFEFTWDRKLDKFSMVRKRLDKHKPNRSDVANDNWKVLHNPLTENVMRGRKFELSFRHHNSEKLRLYNYVSKALPPSSVRTLLDIGSGRGGDVRKWVDTGFTHVICVEPNEKNRKELTRRLAATKLIYRIIPTNGQDYQEIIKHVMEFAPNRTVDVVAYMLSLSFFFDKTDSFNSILILNHSVLAKGGFFIGLTIDGNLVSDFFNNANYYLQENNVKKANFKTITFELHIQDETQYIYVDIPDTIVEEQREYLTNLPILIEYMQLPEYGMSLINYDRTNKELFMTDEEILYTSLFTTIVMKRL